MRSPVVVYALVALAGCHSVPTASAPAATSAAPPAARVARASPASAEHPDRVIAREVLTAIGGFTDETCACADAECVGDVRSRMGAWTEPRLPRIQELRPTPEENATAEALQTRMAGCLAKFEAPVMPLTGDVILSQLRGWKDEICACNDKACVATVQERMLAWAMANLDAMEGIEPTEDQDAEADRLDAELTGCIARIDSGAL